MSDKIEDIKEQKEESLEEKVVELNNKYLYLAAEFDNFKKRTLKEKTETIEWVKNNFYNNFLTVIDDVERSIQNTKDSNDITIVKDGNKVIHNTFQKYLKDNNIEEINPVDEQFNSDYHDAISTIDVGDDKKNKVITVVQKGYKVNGKMIRFAKVIVGK
jgi:molecular chaperone GrpE